MSIAWNFVLQLEKFEGDVPLIAAGVGRLKQPGMVWKGESMENLGGLWDWECELSITVNHMSEPKLGIICHPPYKGLITQVNFKLLEIQLIQPIGQQQKLIA